VHWVQSLTYIKMLEKTTDFRLGESKITLAEIMVARSKAGIASKATMQIRNKAIEGYKEIMSMTV
jgi:flagellar hook-basal body complex protein FliE